MLKSWCTLAVLALILVFKNSSAAPKLWSSNDTIANISTTSSTLNPNFTNTSPLYPNNDTDATWYTNVTTSPDVSSSPYYSTTSHPNVTYSTPWESTTWLPTVTSTTITPTATETSPAHNVTTPVPPGGNSYFEETRRVVKTYFEEVIRRIWRSGNNATIQVDRNITEFS